MTIHGWDASHYDWSRGPMDIGSAVGAGIKFMIHKAGGDAQDQQFASWWTRAKPLRDSLHLGAYWVLYPGSPVSRADAFIGRLDAAAPGWRDGPFILQADCEKWGGNPNTMPSWAEINAFCDRLVQQTGGRLRPMAYAPKWAYGNTLAGLRYPLWASSYVTGAGPYGNLYPGDQSARWVSYSGITPMILQYSSSATIGRQPTCDANAFRGTLDQFRAMVAPGFTQGDDVTAQDNWNYPIAQGDSDTLWHAQTVLSDTRRLAVQIEKAVSQGRAEVQDLLTKQADAIAALAAKVSGIEDVDEQAIVAGVLAGLTPESIANAIPAALAGSVADILAARLAD